MSQRALYAYTPAAKVFHWLTVLLLTVQVALGWTVPDARRHVPPALLNDAHMTLGFTILALIVLRLAWRFIAGAPPAEPGTPAWQDALARLVHYGLYALVLLFAVTGWANATFHGWPIRYLGAIPLPGFFPGLSWVRSFGHIHNLLVWVLIAAVAGHALAALYHHFIMRDRTLVRMLPQSDDAVAAR